MSSFLFLCKNTWFSVMSSLTSTNAISLQVFFQMQLSALEEHIFSTIFMCA